MATTDEKADMALKAILILLELEKQNGFNRNVATQRAIDEVKAQIEAGDSP